MPNKAFSRLAKMRRPARLALVLALGVAAAAALASCGGGKDAKLLPGATAQEITENLDLVKQYAEEGECIGAADAAGEVSTQVEALGGVDPKLKQALQRGAARLNEVVAICEESSTEAVAPPSEAPSGDKEPPGQEKKAEKEREKEEKEAEKQEKKEPPGPPTTPTETTPEEPPVPPSESGGTGAPGGVSPGAPAAPGGE
jgi:hypothetical protein